MISDGSIPNEAYIVIGNGFDIECGLPTTYKDFLKFLKEASHLLDAGGFIAEPTELDSRITDKLRKTSFSQWKPVLETFWYKHFSEVAGSIRGGWLSFENEISRVIRTIESSMIIPDSNGEPLYLAADDKVVLKQSTEKDANDFRSILMKLNEIGRGESRYYAGQNYFEFEITYQGLSEYLYNDLETFIDALEIYFRDYVTCIAPTITDNIELLIQNISYSGSKYVLSFNYTDTFEKMLRDRNIRADYCYVHGKIREEKRNGEENQHNRLVLGTNEYRDKNDLKKYIAFAPFRKYNQRIYKGTDSNYIDWQKHIDTTPTRRHLYIFGHALGTPDHDILKHLIKGNQMDTTVYYYKPSTFSNQVGNLTEMLGKKEMIARNGGSERTMEFKEQIKTKDLK